MANDEDTRLPLPDSLLKRSQGLLESAMSNPAPRPWAEHLELVSEDGRLTSIPEMLELMRSEMDRLQRATDAEVEPDRYAEAQLGSYLVGLLNERVSVAQHEVNQDVRLGILAGYMYGRGTGPSKSSISAGTMALIKVMQADIKRKQGGLASGQSRIEEAELRMQRAKQHYDRLANSGKDERNIAARVAEIMGVTSRTVRTWKSQGWVPSAKKRK